MTSASNTSDRFAGNQDTGLLLSEIQWLETHFEACRAGYQDQLRAAGLQPGWRVLDLGCGPGSFIPMIAEAIGPGGTIHGVDLSESLIQSARKKYTRSSTGCDIEFGVANALELPYSNNEFDAIWCSNLTQYLGDEDFETLVAECRRVAKSGGLIAIKDWDLSLFRVQPAAHEVIWRFATESIRAFENASREKEAPYLTQINGIRRISHVRSWLARFGVRDVRQYSTLIDMQNPMPDIQRAWCIRLLQMFGGIAKDLGVDVTWWANFDDPGAPDCLLNDPHFLCSEGSTLGIGRNP